MVNVQSKKFFRKQLEQGNANSQIELKRAKQVDFPNGKFSKSK